MKIKAIPIKSESLCDKCIFDCTDVLVACGNHCPMYNSEIKDNEAWHCKCLNIENGKPCRHFKRKENTQPTKMTPGFFVERCKCGGNIYVQFGFSCTGKPMSTLRCDNCFKAVNIIGFLEHGKQFMDYWEGADNG